MWFGKNDDKWDEDYDGSVTQVKTTCTEDLGEKIKTEVIKKELEEYFYTIIDLDNEEE